MKHLLLIVSGGIAAYKALELVRLCRKAGWRVTPVLTNGGAQFITPLSLSALAGEECHTDLWSLKDEAEMRHIRLSRECDRVLVAPASADLIAKMAHGTCDDLASTLLLASDKPVTIAPAMNPVMWENAATQANIETLRQRGIEVIGPAAGDMACGETGLGRMLEAEEIFAHLDRSGPLQGKKAVVTAGPTYEAVDPVRFIGNHSSGKQGYAIAAALAAQGAEVTLVSGPTALCAPSGVTCIKVTSATDMLAAVQGALPADIFIAAAAVADWMPEEAAPQKMKKGSADTLALKLVRTPDILAEISRGKTRPALVIGFAAETEHVEKHATDKRVAKGCDWLLANNVADSGVFGGDDNEICFISDRGVENWPRQSKQAVARRLAQKIEEHF